MQVRIVAVGRVRERYIQEGMMEYAKRLRAYAKVEVFEVREESYRESASDAERAQVLEREGERVLHAIDERSFVIALCVEGEMLTSEALSKRLDDLALGGQSQLTFAIGGSLGLAQAVKDRAGLRWSLSRLTFPHQLVRLLLLEQLYRAYSISRGERYHK